MSAADPSNQTPRVEVTLKEVYDLLLEVSKKVNSMEPQKGQLDDHEQRIRSLEKWIWRASGMAALGGAGLGQVIAQMLGN